MKKPISYLLAAMLIMSTAVMGSCSSSETADPGTPPEEIVSPRDKASKDDSGTDTATTAEEDFGEFIPNAVSVKVGKKGKTDYGVTMYDNDAARMMLDYLPNDDLLFPTYTYDDEQGFVGQRVRGDYTRDNEVTVTEVHAGELFLFSGNQLRLYFKDAEDVDITATPIGFFSSAGDLTEAVEGAYNDNKGDTWGVDVYFIITKK